LIIPKIDRFPGVVNCLSHILLILNSGFATRRGEGAQAIW